MGKQSNHCGVRPGRRWTTAHRRAFTLVEVIIVLAIVLLLSGLVGVQVFQRRGEAKSQAAQIDMNTIRNGMRLFYLDFDRFPTDEEGVAVLWDRSRLEGDEEEMGRWKRYLERPLQTDRWGSPWGYRQVSEFDESEYDLWSWGPDKQDGTDDDIPSVRRENDEFSEPLPGGR
jgi:general secretion pathway protein G